LRNSNRKVKYLTRDFVVDQNKSFPDKCDMGKDNLLSGNSLDYLVDFVKLDYFPDLYQKAAYYADKIIKGHIFYDGNKRTAMKCMFYFLEINGAIKPEDLSNDEIVEMALSLAEDKISWKELATWLSAKYRLKGF